MRRSVFHLATHSFTATLFTWLVCELHCTFINWPEFSKSSKTLRVKYIYKEWKKIQGTYLLKCHGILKSEDTMVEFPLEIWVIIYKLPPPPSVSFNCCWRFVVGLQCWLWGLWWSSVDRWEKPLVLLQGFDDSTEEGWVLSAEIDC